MSGSYSDNTLSLVKQGGGSVDIPFEGMEQDFDFYLGSSPPVNYSPANYPTTGNVFSATYTSSTVESVTSKGYIVSISSGSSTDSAAVFKKDFQNCNIFSQTAASFDLSEYTSDAKSLMTWDRSGDLQTLEVYSEFAIMGYRGRVVSGGWDSISRPYFTSVSSYSYPRYLDREFTGGVWTFENAYVGSKSMVEAYIAVSYSDAGNTSNPTAIVTDDSGYPMLFELDVSGNDLSFTTAGHARLYISNNQWDKTQNGTLTCCFVLIPISG